MDLIRVLVGLHPKAWRQEYGDEFAALLEDTGVTPRIAADVLLHAAVLHLRARVELVLVVAALLLTVAAQRAALETGVTVNILWAPTDPIRAAALVAQVAPGVALLARLVRRRRRLGASAAA